MSLKNRTLSRNKNKLKYSAYNIGISFLFIIVIAFIISGIDRLFYNSENIYPYVPVSLS